MVSIEYSPNGRASCQKCRGNIQSGAVRVCSKGAPVSRSSGYVNKYTHADCYTNRKDLTQLWGFRDLRIEDQKRLMSEEQRRVNFPSDYVNETTATKSGLQKRSINLCDDGSSDDVQQQPTKKQKSKATTNDDKKSAPFTITGLKYAEVSASVGERVTLVREAENQYDSNAIKVVNKQHKTIGRISRDHAKALSKSIDSIRAKLQAKGQRLVVVGIIVNEGNGYEQSVQVSYEKVTLVNEDNGGGGKISAKDGYVARYDKGKSDKATQASKAIAGMRW